MKLFSATSDAAVTGRTDGTAHGQESRVSEPYPGWTILFLAISCAGLSILYAPALYSLSVDVAHHYALVATIMRDWRVGPEFLPNLDEMNFYPNLSHWLAAVIGGLLDGGLAGMSILTIVALTVIWGVAGLFLKELGLIPALIAGGILVHLVSRFGFGSVHGDEIIGNFFFAQVVGEAGFYVGAWTLFSLHRRGSGRWGDAFVPLFVYFVAWVHLLPALKLVAFFGLLTAIEMIQAIRARGKLPWTALASTAIAAVVVLKHPSFAAMRKIAANDGALSFLYPSQLQYLAGIALLLMFISLVLVAAGWRAEGAFKASRTRFTLGMIGCMGAATAGLMLMQAGALAVTGSGSLYAVKKHMFGVHSMLLFEIAVLMMLPVSFAISELVLTGKAVAASVTERFARGLVPALLPVAVLMSIMPPQVSEIAKVVPYQRFAAHYLAYHSGDAGSEKTLFIHGGVPPALNYLISIGDLRHPRGDTVLKLLVGRPVGEAADASRVITNPGNALYDRPNCRVADLSNSNTVVVDQHCVRTTSNAPVEAGRRFEFTTAGDGALLLLDGWFASEAWGTWSNGSTAEIAIPPLDSRQPFAIEIQASGFQPTGSEAVAVTVRLAGERVGEMQLGSQDIRMKIDIPASVAAAGEPIRIGFDIANPRSPQQVGLSSDGRLIGIGLKSISYLD
ncbi:hypothetical protein JL100_017525 [Skermanella mucosa]|uniref:DUF7024 domain-containing protein n=1 Tax=Skermanella mucosa TaxID=1789672 RepID=UPI00192B8B16|nr:hypothetical protein [Skermanella mucosa]UEM18891.1 hypothetical protein JL100_017525 [Skermanella mucosa]